MSAIIKNISVQSVSASVLLGINTAKKAVSTNNNVYKSYSSTSSKNWYYQSNQKSFFMDWDVNQNELEFE